MTCHSRRASIALRKAGGRIGKACHGGGTRTSLIYASATRPGNSPWIAPEIAPAREIAQDIYP